MTFNNLSTLVQTVQHKPGLGVVSDWPERLFGFHCSTIQTSVLETWWLTASTSNVTSMICSKIPARTQNKVYPSASITSLKMEIEIGIEFRMHSCSLPAIMLGKAYWLCWNFAIKAVLGPLCTSPTFRPNILRVWGWTPHNPMPLHVPASKAMNV